MGSRGMDLMNVIDERKTTGQGQNEPEQIPVPMAAQTTFPPMPEISSLTPPSNKWTSLSKRSGDTETYRNWGINE